MSEGVDGRMIQNNNNKLIAGGRTRMIAGVSMRVARYASVSKLVDVSGGGQHGPDAHTRHGALCTSMSTPIHWSTYFSEL